MEQVDSSPRLKRILDRYGELLTCDDLADLLKYSSAGAVRQAHATGKLPIPLFRFPGRRPLFAFAKEVAIVLDSVEDQGCVK